MKRLITLVLVILTTFQAIQAEHHDDHSQQHHKKDQLGFFGSRGKRSINTEPSITNEIDDGNEASLKELSGLRDTILGMQRNVRAPKGFFGMRGKKDYDLLIQEKRALLGNAQNGIRDRTRFVDPAEVENDGAFFPKRAPSQSFFGMRGKKFGDYDISGSANDKRAPKGFMGMRGKKNFDDEENDDSQLYDYNYNSVYEKRAPSGFFGVRGKKLFSDSKPSIPMMFR